MPIRFVAAKSLFKMLIIPLISRVGIPVLDYISFKVGQYFEAKKNKVIKPTGEIYGQESSKKDIEESNEKTSSPG